MSGTPEPIRPRLQPSASRPAPAPSAVSHLGFQWLAEHYGIDLVQPLYSRSRVGTGRLREAGNENRVRRFAAAIARFSGRMRDPLRQLADLAARRAR